MGQRGAGLKLVRTRDEAPDYIDIEPNEVTIEPEPPRAPKAGAPSSSPGVPYKPEVEPAAE